MITVANYQTEINKIDWSKLPAAIKAEKDGIDGIIEFYNDDADIKETVDLFIELVNKNLPKEPKPTPSVKKEPSTQSKKEEVEKMSLRRVMSKTKYLQDVMPPMQQQALFEMENSEEREFFVEKILELDDILASSTKQQDKPLMDSMVKMHFFYGDTDWFILDYQPKSKTFFGYVILNGDVEMSEAGYISIADLHSVKRVEMDFYWNETTLLKALNSRYPSDFPIEKETEKTSPKNSPSKPSKTKVKKVVTEKDYQAVTSLTPGFMLIRRFYNMIKSGSVQPFAKVRSLYMAFQKAAIERKVGKSFEDAELFTKVSEKVTKLFKDFAEPSKADVKISSFPDDLKKEMETYVTGKKVSPAVNLLKRFVSMQGTQPNVKSATTLLKSITKLLEGNNTVETFNLAPYLIDAKKELEDYIKKPSEKIEPTQYGLSRPRSVCTNRVKCTGIDKTGKLHKGYKFQEGTGHVVKVRKSKLGSPKCVNRVKCTGLTKSGKLMKGYKFEEGTGNVVRVSRKKKSSTKKKGLGVVQVIEHTPIQEIYHNPIVPIVKENTNQLGYTPNPTPMVDNVENNPYENEEVKNPPFEQKPVVKNKLMSMTFDYLEMDEGWEDLMQNPARNMRIAIWGPPKNGKTAAALQMADYLSKFGKVLYNFADQGFNKSTQDLWISSGLAENANCEPNDASTLQALEKEINTGKYDFVFIDMISDYIRTEKIKPEDFKENFIRKYPNISFILIFEVTKDGNFKGDQGWTHLVDATMTVKDFLIENRGRYGMGEKVIWEEGLRKFNPKKYDEIYLSKPIQEI